MLLIGAVAGCDDGGQSVSIQSVEVAAEGRALEVTVDGCGQVAIDVDERADRVSLAASVEGDDGDCASGDLVQLDAPLGEREIVDALTGDTVPGGPPTEAESDPVVLAWPRSCWSQPTQAACAEIGARETFMASEVGGELVVEGDCAMTDDGSGASAVLLPYGTAWDPTVPGLRFADGSTVAVGAEVWVMGGWFERLDRSRTELTYNDAQMVSGELLERVWTCIDASEHPGAIQIASP